MLLKHMGGMGSLDMKWFNRALLARLAWRLVAHPDSLCACLLKAKYFPNGEMIDTVFPTDSSPSWKGIEFGLELLKKESYGEWGMAIRFRFGGIIGYPKILY